MRIACTLTDKNLRSQRDRWIDVFASAGTERIETADGLRLVFTEQSGVADELRALVAVENECCSWAQWSVSAEDGRVLMDARSRGDGVAALHGMFLTLSRAL